MRTMAAGGKYSKDFDDLLSQFKTICPPAQLEITLNGTLGIVNRKDVCADKKLLGCCCLCELTESAFTYAMKIDAGTKADGKWVTPHNAPIDAKNRSREILVAVAARNKLRYGFYKKGAQGQTAVVEPLWRITAHEVCAHSWFEHHRKHEVQQGPCGNRPTHDQAIIIENSLSKEADKNSLSRPLFGEDPYHGEVVYSDPDGNVTVPDIDNPTNRKPYSKPKTWE